jgi:hypothetical protein
MSDVHLNEQLFYCNAECHILKGLCKAMMSVILQSVVMLRVITLSVIQCLLTMSMRLCHPQDGSTSPKYKLLCFKLP